MLGSWVSNKRNENFLGRENWVWFYLYQDLRLKSEEKGISEKGIDELEEWNERPKATTLSDKKTENAARDPCRLDKPIIRLTTKISQSFH